MTEQTNPEVEVVPDPPATEPDAAPDEGDGEDEGNDEGSEAAPPSQ